MTQPFEQRDLAARVDVEVEERVGHRVEVTDLTGEVEDQLRLRGRRPCRRLAEVGADDRDPSEIVRGAWVGVEVVRVGAVAGMLGVDDRHACSAACERPCDVRADEAQTAGDQGRPPIEGARV